MRENTQAAIGLVFGHEGGYVNRKTDAGGPTKFGITAKTLGNWRKLGRPATANEVKALTIAEAEEILRAQYLKPIRFDDLPAGLDYATFDFSTNSGPAQAAKTLQRTVGADPDGVIGAQTLAKIRERCQKDGGLESLIVDYIDARMKFLRGLGGKQGFSSNGRGWTIRVTGKDPKGQYKDAPGVIGHALAMAKKSPLEARKILADPVASPAIPEAEILDQSRAVAEPAATKLSSTSQGKAIITAATGAISAAVASATASIAPYVDSVSFAKPILVGLTVVGVSAAIVGIGWNAVAEMRRVASGEPV